MSAKHNNDVRIMPPITAPRLTPLATRLNRILTSYEFSPAYELNSQLHPDFQGFPIDIVQFDGGNQRIVDELWLPFPGVESNR